MELLLNLLWLALALVALGCCWRVSRFSGKAGRSRAFVLTGCLLALVFPIVSASDDLAAMRAEMEEGNSSSSVKKSAASHLTITGNGALPFAEADRADLVPPLRDLREKVSEYCCGLSHQLLSVTTGSRAPPYLESIAPAAPFEAAQFFQVGLNAAIPDGDVVLSELRHIRPHIVAARFVLRSSIWVIPLQTASRRRTVPRQKAQILCPRTCARGRMFLPTQET